MVGPDASLIEGIAALGQPERPPQMRAPATAPATATPFNSAGERTDGEQAAANGTIGDGDLDDDDDMENWLSVSAIEAELKPKVIETLTPSPVPTKAYAACRTKTSSSSSKGCRSRLRRNASIRN